MCLNPLWWAWRDIHPWSASSPGCLYLLMKISKVPSICNLWARASMIATYFPSRAVAWATARRTNKARNILIIYDSTLRIAQGVLRWRIAELHWSFSMLYFFLFTSRLSLVTSKKSSLQMLFSRYIRINIAPTHHHTRKHYGRLEVEDLEYSLAAMD